MSELKMMTHLGNHENIVNLLGACTLSGNQFLLKTSHQKYFRLKTERTFVLHFPSFLSHSRGPETQEELDTEHPAIRWVSVENRMPLCTGICLIILTYITTVTALKVHVVVSPSTCSDGASPSAARLASVQWGKWPQSLAVAAFGLLQIRHREGRISNVIFPAFTGACALIHFCLEIPEKCARGSFLLGLGQKRREQEQMDPGGYS